MANTYTTTADGDNSTDAKFRIWGKWIDDQLLAMGFTQVTDNGATASNGGTIDWTTVTKPGASSTMQIYSIFRFPDGALQTSHPLFFRIDYGSGRTSANNPGIKLQLGQSSNGSGVLGGAAVTTQVFMDTGATANGKHMWACGKGSEGRFMFFLWDDSGTAALNCFFGIERSRDISTAAMDSRFAHMVAYGDFTYMAQAGRTGITTIVPNVGSGARVTLGLNSLVNVTGSHMKGSNIQVYPIWGLMNALGTPSGSNLGPLFGLVLVPYAGITEGATFTATHYGATRTFLPGQLGTAGGSTASSYLTPYTITSAVVPAILWE